MSNETMTDEERMQILQRLFVAAEELSRTVSAYATYDLHDFGTPEGKRKVLADMYSAMRRFSEVPSYTGPLDKLDRDVETARADERRKVWEKAAEEVEEAFKAIPSTPETDAAHNVLVTRFMSRAFFGERT